MNVYFSGLLLGLSLIIALGPQNIFLIRQGALRQHAMLSAFICFLSDILLVTGSVIGLHEVLEIHPKLQFWIACFGSVFLVYYGGKNMHAGLFKTSKEIKASEDALTRWQIITLALGFSLLNPHAIIDSIVLIGGGSMMFPDQKQYFLFGVISSSLIWFMALTFTAYYFANVLTKPKIWRRVECLSGILMIYLSIKLVSSQF